MRRVALVLAACVVAAACSSGDDAAVETTTSRASVTTAVPLPTVTLDEAAPSVSELLADDRRLVTFARLLEESGIALPEGATILAPIESAFLRGAGSIGTEPVGTDPEVRELLRYHVIEGLYSADELILGGSRTSWQGEQIEVDAERIILNGTARLVDRDLVASDGIVHTIDTLLVPPSRVQTVEEQ